MKRTFKLLVLSLFFTPSIFSAPRSYLIVGRENAPLPVKIQQQVEQAGGKLIRHHRQIGLVEVESADENFQWRARNIPGVENVIPNIRWTSNLPMALRAAPAQLAAQQSADAEEFFALQWNLRAIEAPAAWQAGVRGRNARVVVLDTGIDAEHPDIAPNLKTALCRSFIPGEDFNIQPNNHPDAWFSHGTHVAGIIAAALNGFGIIGVAPEAELVAVKVLSEFTGYGTIGGMVAGILYAADIEADVINISLGAVYNREGAFDDNGTPEPEDDIWLNSNEVAALVRTVSRAIRYANSRGATIVAAAGNDALNRDLDGRVIYLPADCPRVLSISATGPMSLGINPAADLDQLAFYSNYGQSSIDFAAPGGNLDFSLFEEPIPMCGPFECLVYDMVFSAGNEGYFFSIGTSMAAPHVAGVAALIISRHGGSLSPSTVELELRKSADDLGETGRDAFYGAGRVNAGTSSHSGN